MEKIYAQILKSNMQVNLVGGKEVGLPIENHPLAFCVDITGLENVTEGMVYNAERKEFLNSEVLPILPVVPQPTTEEQILFETKYQTLLLETMALGGTN